MLDLRENSLKSTLTVYKNVYINWTHILWKFGEDMCYQEILVLQLDVWFFKSFAFCCRILIGMYIVYFVFVYYKLSVTYVNHRFLNT